MEENSIASTIINRGRGPEISGTRITVYRIMDFVRDNSPRERMASELRLSMEQVETALAYLAEHRADVEAEYEAILARPRKNPEWVTALMAKSPEELKQRILARAAMNATRSSHQ